MAWKTTCFFAWGQQKSESQFWECKTTRPKQQATSHCKVTLWCFSSSLPLIWRLHFLMWLHSRAGRIMHSWRIYFTSDYVFQFGTSISFQKVLAFHQSWRRQRATRVRRLEKCFALYEPTNGTGWTQKSTHRRWNLLEAGYIWSSYRAFLLLRL